MCTRKMDKICLPFGVSVVLRFGVIFTRLEILTGNKRDLAGNWHLYPPPTPSRSSWSWCPWTTFSYVWCQGRQPIAMRHLKASKMTLKPKRLHKKQLCFLTLGQDFLYFIKQFSRSLSHTNSCLRSQIRFSAQVSHARWRDATTGNTIGFAG